MGCVRAGVWVWGMQEAEGPGLCLDCPARVNTAQHACSGRRRIGMLAFLIDLERCAFDQSFYKLRGWLPGVGEGVPAAGQHGRRQPLPLQCKFLHFTTEGEVFPWLSSCSITRLFSPIKIYYHM